MSLLFHQGSTVRTPGRHEIVGIAKLKGAHAATHHVFQDRSFASGAPNRVDERSQENERHTERGVNKQQFVRFDAKHGLWRGGNFISPAHFDAAPEDGTIGRLKSNAAQEGRCFLFKSR